MYVSFSGGKDSTVLLDLARRIYPEVEAVFLDTGLEFPEIRSFVKTFDNVITLRPKMRFPDVIDKYGYPVISKYVSEDIYYAQKGRPWAINRANRLNSDGSFSEYRSNRKDYSNLVNAPFKIGSYCCNVMKKSPPRRMRKVQGRNRFWAQ